MKGAVCVKRLETLLQQPKRLKLQHFSKKKASKSKGSRRPLVPKRLWQELPKWIALHAERGQMKKCWEGHRLRSDTQDGRRHGYCVKCKTKPRAGTPIMICRGCSWAICSHCHERPRLPKLHEDPLFHGPSQPMLLWPPFEEQAVTSLGQGTIIVCPGGNYEFLCPNEGLPVAAWLAQLGIHAVVLRYRLLPNHTLKDALDDLEAAVALVRQKRGGPVGAIGFSAGGHLVASVALRLAKRKRPKQQPLDAQVLIYPCIDGEGWLEPDQAGFFNYEACYEKAPDLLAERKALLGGRGFKAPPTFLVGSTEDNVCVPKEHSDIYAAALKKRRIAHRYLRGNFGEHGFGLSGVWTEKCGKWLRKFGFGEH